VLKTGAPSRSAYDHAARTAEAEGPMVGADKAEWISKVLGVQVSGPRADPGGVDAGGSASAVGAPNLASADRKSVSVQIVNTTDVALSWSGTTYDPNTTTIIGTADGDLPAGGNISFAVNYRTVDDGGQPAVLPFGVHYTGEDTAGGKLSVLAGFLTNGTSLSLTNY